MIKTLIVCLFLYAVIGCQKDRTRIYPTTPVDLIGKTIEYRYGESVYHVTFDSDSTLHWKAMAGEEKGALEHEVYIVEFVDNSKMFITWGEANGIGVSQVLDFERGIVYNHLLRDRTVNSGEGKIRVLD